MTKVEQFKQANEIANTNRLWPLYGFAVLLALLVIYGHRGNLHRLMQGIEPRIGTSGENRI